VKKLNAGMSLVYLIVGGLQIAVLLNLVPSQLTIAQSSFPGGEGYFPGGDGPRGGGLSPVGGTPPVAPRPLYNPPPPPPPTVTPPPTSTVRHTPVIPHSVQTNFFNQPQPIDLTNQFLNLENNVVKVDPIVSRVLDGVQTVPLITFETPDANNGNSDWILVRGDESSVYQRPTPISAKLESGTILVSVRRPSQFCLVNTPLGVISVHSDGDVLISYIGDKLRVFNLSARGSDLKIKFASEVLGGGKQQAIKVRPGFEIVAATHKLHKTDLRPGDGVARRRFEILANGNIGINEFSAQSVLQNSAVVAAIIQKTNDAKETRILSQMSKMAAVLNHVNGTQGYAYENVGVAAAPGKQPQ
jgi:hypothetical protein